MKTFTNYVNLCYKLHHNYLHKHNYDYAEYERLIRKVSRLLSTWLICLFRNFWISLFWWKLNSRCFQLHRLIVKLFILILFRFCFCYFFSRVLECNVTRSASRKEQLATLPYFRNTPIRLCFFLFFLFFLFYHQLTHYLILCLDVLTLFTVIISLFYTSLFIFFFLSLTKETEKRSTQDLRVSCQFLPFLKAYGT